MSNRDFYLRDKVRRARNAAAHNNCFINDLRSVKEPLGNGKERCNKDEEVMTALAKVGVILAGFRSPDVVTIADVAGRWNIDL